MKYRPDIDGLRAIAVLAVVAFHGMSSVVPGGFVGVDIFFVISGFLITGILQRELKEHSFSFRSFYSRRIRRLFPALLTVLVFVLVAGWVELYSEEFSRLGWQVLAAATFTSNFLFWREAGYFDTSAVSKPLLHLWSLAVEEQFYLIWPLVMLVAWRKKVSLTIASVLIGITSFAINLALVRKSPESAFFLPFSRFWELMLGASISPAFIDGLSKTLRDGLSLLGLLAIGLSIALIRQDGFPGAIALLPTVGTALLLVAGPDAVVNRMLSSWALVSIGLISYPLYLWHWPLLVFLNIATYGTSPAPYIALTILLSFVLALATYELVERKVRLFPRAADVLAIGMVAVATIGTLPVAMEGFANRKANSYASLLQGARPLSHGVSDGSCSGLVENPELRNEVCLSLGSTPTVLIVGDSHAMSLTSAAASEGLRTLLIAGSSCLPFRGYQLHGASEPNSNRNCDRIAQEAFTAAAKIKSLRTVILATMGPAYFADPVDYHIYRDSRLASNQERAFVDGYVSAIREFQQLGLNVIFLIDVPELGFDPSACAPRNISLVTEPACLLSRGSLDRRQARYRELISEISHQTPGSVVYDSAPLFCDTTICKWWRDGRSLYFDKNHLSLAGSRLVLRNLMPWLISETGVPR